MRALFYEIPLLSLSVLGLKMSVTPPSPPFIQICVHNAIPLSSSQCHIATLAVAHSFNADKEKIL